MVNAQQSTYRPYNSQPAHTIPPRHQAQPSYSNQSHYAHHPRAYAPEPSPTDTEASYEEHTPQHLRDACAWYPSEFVRPAARDIHNRIYVPAGAPGNRYDALFRPIITCAIEWSEVFGPYFVVRMWRWTGYFAPGGDGMVVEKFVGRHGLRDQKTLEPVGFAAHLYKFHAGFSKLKPEMIKLPPNGTAKLNIPDEFDGAGKSIEVLLEGFGAEVVESGLWEGNLTRRHSGIKVRIAESPLIIGLRLAFTETPFRPVDVPRTQPYDPQGEPIPVLGWEVPPQEVANIYHSTARARTPATIAPALQKTHISPSDTVLKTPEGGDVYLEIKTVAEEGTYRVGPPARGRR